MVIIVEGPDRTGKTTQIAKMKEHYEAQGKSVQVIHYESIKKDEGFKYNAKILQQMSRVRYDDMLNLANTFAEDDKTVLIFDRAHLGELVYAPLFRKYGGEYVFNLEDKYPTFLEKTKLFVFVDEAKNLVKRDDGKSLGKVTKKTKQREKDLFEVAFECSNIKDKHLININKTKEEKVWELVKEKLV